MTAPADDRNLLFGVLALQMKERIYRDVRVCQIYEGTSDVQKIIIQRAL